MKKSPAPQNLGVGVGVREYFIKGTEYGSIRWYRMEVDSDDENQLIRAPISCVQGELVGSSVVVSPAPSQPLTVLSAASMARRSSSFWKQ